jgi:signal transduction histidine kinase/ActR/RegA family two-component response regulator
MLKPPDYPAKDRLPQLLTLAVALTLLTLGWLGWTVFQGYRFVTEQLPASVRMEELRGQILLFDEILTMSARMAAASGDPQWEARYRQFEPKLDQALKEALRLIPEAASRQSSAQTDAAITKLVAMESLAFEYVRQGKGVRARQVMSSEEYQTQKEVYAAGMAKFSRSLEQAIDSVQKQKRAQVFWSSVMAAISAPVLMICWWFVLRAARQWRTALIQSNEQLNRQAEELKQFSRQLDEKVGERTRQLKNSESALLNMMDDTVRSREKVEQAYEDLKREVAERRKVEAQLLQSQKMEAVGQLASGVAHDFNNLLVVIQGYTEMLLAQENLAHDVRENLRLVFTAGERAASLTSQLLTFSRKQVMKLRVLNLSEVVADVAKMLKRVIGENIALEFEYAQNLQPIQADTGMLEQVLMNLAVNARDAMPKGGHLVIDISTITVDAAHVARQTQARAGEFVMLSVRDSGCGMTPEVQARIFEPFFTTKAPGKGTGLGLATVYGIAQQHNGWVEVDSRIGSGTTFKIFFPALPLSAKPTETAVAKAKTQGGSETILVVEDEDAVRELAVIVLEKHGYRVLQAASGDEAVAVWKRHRERISLLLTDMVMPGELSGWELAQQLLDAQPGLKVIYTSGYSDDVALDVFSMGKKVNFVQKPYQPSKLAQAVRQALDGTNHETKETR